MNNTPSNEMQYNNYIIGEPIDQGQFVTVYTCTHNYSSRLFAARFIWKNKIEQCECKARIIFNESILSPLLIHPHIIQVQDFFETDNAYVHISKLYRNNLLNTLQTNFYGENLKFSVIYEILQAVAYLHSHYIAHRDLKLENIVLTKSNHIKLIDFGLSTISFSGIVNNTCGSYPYLSPESFSGTYNVFAADIWAIGVIIYAIFKRKMPFENVCPGFDFPKPDFLGIPPQVTKLLESFLNKNPNDRPTAQSALQSPAFRFFRIQAKKMAESPFGFLSMTKSPSAQDTVQLMHANENKSMFCPEISKIIEFPDAAILNRISKILQNEEKYVAVQLIDSEPNLSKLLYYMISEKEKQIDNHFSLPMMKRKINFEDRFQQSSVFTNSIYHVNSHGNPHVNIMNREKHQTQEKFDQYFLPPQAEDF